MSKTGPKPIDLTGQRFGRLTVIGLAEPWVSPKTGVAKRRWTCQCDCGNRSRTFTRSLRNGQQSCGCIRVEKFAEACRRPKTKRPLTERFWEKVDKDGLVPSHMPHLGQCWVWTSARDASDGYGYIREAGANIRAHRLSYEWANEPVPEGLCVLHHCDNPPCVRPDHLFVGTQEDNAHDRDEKGRGKWLSGDHCWPRIYPEKICRGERHGMVKLTEADVLAIRAALETGEMASKLADRYGVSRAQITNIKQRKAWWHI